MTVKPLEQPLCSVSADKNRPTVFWSCGGGVQSVAVGVLIAECRLPKPDLAAIVDTGRERRTTWDYLENHLNPYLLKHCGFTVEVVGPSFKRVDLYTAEGKPLVAAYSHTGRLAGYCSGEWKRDAMERWLRGRGVKRCVQWLGFSTDEKSRAKGKAHRPWLQPAYPLIELGLSWDDCVAIIEKAGLPRPQKSRCWCCPNQSGFEWKQTLTDPVDGPLALSLDAEIREADQAHDLYLHQARVPLHLSDRVDADASLPASFCQEGGCHT